MSQADEATRVANDALAFLAELDDTVRTTQSDANVTRVERLLDMSCGSPPDAPRYELQVVWEADGSWAFQPIRVFPDDWDELTDEERHQRTDALAEWQMNSMAEEACGPPWDWADHPEDCEGDAGTPHKIDDGFLSPHQTWVLGIPATPNNVDVIMDPPDGVVVGRRGLKDHYTLRTYHADWRTHPDQGWTDQTIHWSISTFFTHMSWLVCGRPLDEDEIRALVEGLIIATAGSLRPQPWGFGQLGHHRAAYGGFSHRSHMVTIAMRDPEINADWLQLMGVSLPEPKLNLIQRFLRRVRNGFSRHP